MAKTKKAANKKNKAKPKAKKSKVTKAPKIKKGTIKKVSKLKPKTKPKATPRHRKVAKVIGDGSQNLKGTGRPVGRPKVNYKLVTVTYRLNPTEMSLLHRCERKFGFRGKRLFMRLLKNATSSDSN